MDKYMLLYLIVASILCMFIFSETNNRIYKLQQDHEEIKTMIEYSKHSNNSFASVEKDLNKVKNEKETESARLSTRRGRLIQTIYLHVKNRSYILTRTIHRK